VAELIEITWTIGTTQSVPTASPAPFRVARLVRPVFGIDIPSPHLSPGVRRPPRRTAARLKDNGAKIAGEAVPIQVWTFG